MTETDCIASKSLSTTQLCGLEVSEERRKLTLLTHLHFLLTHLHSNTIACLRGVMTTCLRTFCRAYNNMCYLIHKYAPIEGVEQYDPRSDPFVTGAHFQVYSSSD